MKAIVFGICVIAGAILLSDQSSAATRNERDARDLKFAHRQRAVATRPLDVEPKHEVTGVIPRAIRGGNPLEMLNPFAPAKYERPRTTPSLIQSNQTEATGSNSSAFPFS